MIVVFIRQRSQVIKKGVAYNWDNKGYCLKYDTDCKYGGGGGTLEYSVNYTKMLNIHVF